MFGLQKKYTYSEVKIDDTEVFFKQKDYVPKQVYKRANSFTKPVNKPGYCIRTGEQIPFNPDRPLSDEGYRSWKQSGNPQNKENFCHFSGEPSNGETSVRFPVLRKNWPKVLELHSSKQ